MEKPKPAADIDAYIADFSPEVQKRLRQMRAIIRKNAPDAVEQIKWAMPTYYQNGNLVHFAAAKNHIGLYPGDSGVRAFQDRLADYKTSKGAIQLPNTQPLPEELIADIVRFRVKENTQ